MARVIRAFDPTPGSWTELDGREVKLYRAHVVEDGGAGGAGGAPGEIRTTDEGLRIATGQGVVQVEEVQPAGKPRMSAADWMRGRGVRDGQRFA